MTTNMRSLYYMCVSSVYSVVSPFQLPNSQLPLFFFFNYTATPDLSPLPPHDPLPIYIHAVKTEEAARRHHLVKVPLLSAEVSPEFQGVAAANPGDRGGCLEDVLVHVVRQALGVARSEEQTSELPARLDLVCRLLLEKR